MSSESAPIGPVDVAVVVFPQERLGDEVVSAFADTIASGSVRLLDALIVRKNDTGDVTVIDADDEGETLTVLATLGDHQGLLSEDDASVVASELPPGSSAVLVAWENMWAVRLRGAIADAGGAIVAHERIDAERITDTYSRLEVTEKES